MLTIGLTGGIGCGKTTVTQLFKKLGAPIVDADEIAHELVQPERPALKKIIEVFGRCFLQQDGYLNRKKLRQHVFDERSKKEKLEKILHPLILSEMLIQLDAVNFAYGIMSIPLLFETNYQKKVGRVLVIDCAEETQIKRVIKRDHTEQATIKKIVHQQCSREYRLNNADDVIKNNSSIENLTVQVSALHRSYLEISTRNTP